MGISTAEARRIVLRDFNRLLQEPTLEYDDDSLNILLVSSIPPGAVWRCIDRLRARMCSIPSLTRRSEAPSSSSPAAATVEASMPAPRTPVQPPTQHPPPAEPVATTSSAPAAADPPTVMDTDSDDSLEGWWMVRPRNHVFHLPERLHESKKALDHAGKECAHYRRTFPPFTGIQKVRELDAMSPEDVFQLAESILRCWMFKRPILTRWLHHGKQAQYDWAESAQSSRVLDIHNVGRWMWFESKEWRPAPPPGTDVQNETLAGHRLEECVHASSMYTLTSILVNGLEPGTEAGKGNDVGVYAYRRVGQKLAISSSGYAVYSDLAGNGIYFAPRFRIVFQSWRAGEPGVGKISAGDGQLRLTPGMFHITGVWIHIMTHREASVGGPLWFSADDWHPEYGISGTLVDGSLPLARSRT